MSDHLVQLTGGTILLELFSYERPRLLGFLLSPQCEDALASDAAFLAWAQQELATDPDLLSRVRQILRNTRNTLISASGTGVPPDADE